jgi:hypothetical protein
VKWLVFTSAGLAVVFFPIARFDGNVLADSVGLPAIPTNVEAGLAPAGQTRCEGGLATRRLKELFIAVENGDSDLTRKFFGTRRLQPFVSFSTGVVRLSSATNGAAKQIAKFETSDPAELARFLLSRSKQHERVSLASVDESIESRQGVLGLHYNGVRRADDLPESGYVIEGKADFDCPTGLFAVISFGTVQEGLKTGGRSFR